MNALVGFALLWAFWGLGEVLARLLPGAPLSGSLWGMLLLYIALASGRLDGRSVAAAAGPLLRWLGLYFVPVGVGVLAFENLLRDHALAVTGALVLGTLITMLATLAGARWG